MFQEEREDSEERLDVPWAAMEMQGGGGRCAELVQVICAVVRI